MKYLIEGLIKLKGSKLSSLALDFYENNLE